MVPHLVKYPRRPVQLILGKHYIVYYDYKNKSICKFIQPTKCGFNFLNLETNKCIIKSHLYPSKCENHISGNWYFVNNNLKIEEVN